MDRIPTIGLAIIVKADNKEAEMLDRCLASITKYVDNIYITITGKNEKCTEVAKKYNAHIQYFEWIYDFAKAKNYSFKPVKEDWILWLDADDVFEGGENLKSIFEKVTPDISSLIINYLYDFTKDGDCIVKQKRTRIVRNDGTWDWRGQIHEDLFSDRRVIAYEAKGVNVIHLTSEKRQQDAALRNLEIARKGKKADPKDPKYDWDIANALLMAGKFKEAVNVYDEFIQSSGSEEEMYLARCRQGEALTNLGKTEEAMVCYLYAIGIRPRYPTAYFGLGHCYFINKKFEDAEDVILTGLKKKIPEETMLVWNPRDFDYNPLIVLAKVYFNMSKIDKSWTVLERIVKMFPKDKLAKSYFEELTIVKEMMDKTEKIATKLLKIKSKKRLRKKLDALPLDIRSHPKICWVRNKNFIKETSSGKDLVYFCGETEESWTPKTAAEKGIGGSEEHVINLTRELVKLGWNVTVYNSCGHKEQIFDGVIYKPFWEFNLRDKQDVVILWRSPMVADHKINADKIIVDLHDCIASQEWLAQRLKQIDTIVVKSHWQRGLFPNVPDDKFIVLDNCFDLSEYKGLLENDPYTLIYTSSPDRGLKAFLEIFKKVKEKVPQAKAICRYGWGVYDIAHKTDPIKMEWKKEVSKQLQELGIEFTRLSHSEIGKAYQRAGIWLYPSEFGEIHCITAIKAQAAGAVPITTDFSALNETVNFGRKFHSNKNYDNWSPLHKFDYSIDSEEMKKNMVNEIVYLMKNPEEQMKIRKEMVKETLNRYSAKSIAKKWNNLLK